jgi:hypothetical protein
LGTEIDPATAKVMGVGIRGGWWNFVRVFWLGERLAALEGAAGAEGLLGRLGADDPSADSELTAIHLLRGEPAESDLDVEPLAVVGRHSRHPDFRLRGSAAPPPMPPSRSTGTPPPQEEAGPSR